ncbi:aspartic peptidase domain-containing protein [Mycena epipterygia]|nr:aspartic peptidase domain-containing protein [Mycena epipterygia]
MANRARALYGLASPGTPSAQQGLSRRDLNLVDEADAVYLVNIGIGTPPQTVAVMVDTGSADLWLAQSPCSDCPGSSTLYDSTVSSTFSQNSTNTTTISYSEGDSVTGKVANETVQIGPYSVASQAFLQVNDLTSRTLTGPEAGILGLGFGPIASTTKSPFWQAALAQSPSPEMGFWFKRGAQNETSGGAFTFGGTNSSLFTGEIEFLSLAAPPGFWQLNVFGITVEGKAVKITGGPSALSAIDTGTTLLGGPAADVKAIWAAVPGSTASTSMPGFYQFPCDTKVNITVSFGGKAWPINPADINLGPTSKDNNTCLGAIFVITDTVIQFGPNWVFGLTFLKNVYSVFRQTPMSVGFAQLSAVTNATSTTIAGTSLGSGASTAPAATSSSSASSTQTSTVPSRDESTISHIGLIVGGVLAALAVILIGVGVGIYLRRRRTRTEDRNRTMIVSSFPYLTNDERQTEGPASSFPKPGMRSALSTMKREQLAAVHQADNIHAPADVLVRTDGGLQLTPGRVVRGEMGQVDARRQTEVDAIASDPVLNELRSLRAEIMMQRLVTERARRDAPPSYSGHGDADDL